MVHLLYLTETGNQAVTVLGTTEITQISPINPQIVLRDGVVNLNLRLVESSITMLSSRDWMCKSNLETIS